jgi:hypothetical protein
VAHAVAPFAFLIWCAVWYIKRQMALKYNVMPHRNITGVLMGCFSHLALQNAAWPGPTAWLAGAAVGLPGDGLLRGRVVAAELAPSSCDPKFTKLLNY